MYRIAVVEDEESGRKHMKELLHSYEERKGESFDVTCYEDGADFLEDFRGQFDVIFCDIRMPFTDGMTAARAVRAKDSRAGTGAGTKGAHLQPPFSRRKRWKSYPDTGQ